MLRCMHGVVDIVHSFHFLLVLRIPAERCLECSTLHLRGLFVYRMALRQRRGLREAKLYICSFGGEQRNSQSPIRLATPISSLTN